MIFFIMFAVLSLYGLFYVLTSDEWDGDKLFGSFIWFMFSLVGFVAAMFLCFFVGLFVDASVITTEQSIVTLQDNPNAVHGGLLYISTDGEYVYYVKTADDVYEQNTLDVDSVTIRQTATENPRLVSSCPDREITWFGSTGSTQECKYQFVVPRGTIFLVAPL